MVGLYEWPLSLTTMTSGSVLSAAMLFSASHVIPPVRAPSPTTATTERSRRPASRSALAMPSAQLRAAEACWFSTMSWGDSARLG
ncbi:hypothetical protein STEPF1_06090 [Streptomyces sp. F-1]|nr:hypothetical protein STEPF1_06090 [Streptomyces sp. F-1]